MASAESFILSMEQVLERMECGEKVVLADCRFQLGRPQWGREAFARSHLPGAVFFDLEEDLSGPVGLHGGRHPMPDLGILLLKLGERGIDELTTIIAYDDQEGAMASRFWWLLRFVGSERVYVMDGGFSKWERAGCPVVAEGTKDAVGPKVAEEPTVAEEPKVFGGRVQNRLLVVIDDVKERLGRPGTVLIDSREEMRYRGEQEPIDKKSGHLPGAINRYWKENLDANGQWKDRESLKARFASIASDQEIIVYCGSGVTACPNILALAEAGRPDAKLYLGSWSDWISYEGNPIETGEE